MKNIPTYIKLLSKFIPVVDYERKYKDSKTVNLAKGEIKLFNLSEKDKNYFNISNNKRCVEIEFLEDKEYDLIWEHIKDGYFKLISKVE